MWLNKGYNNKMLYKESQEIMRNKLHMAGFSLFMNTTAEIEDNASAMPESFY